MVGRWNVFRNPLGNCFRIATFAYDCGMVRHAVISFQKCVNIMHLIIAKAFPKGDARMPGSRVNVDVSKILVVSCLKTY
jgi:hypothetical protein